MQLEGRVLGQVHAVAFSERNDSPILLQGERISKLRPRHMRAIKATYQAGHTIVLLDPTMLHVKALHQLIGEGVSYRSKNIGQHMAYVLRQENNIPTAKILTNPHSSPLRDESGAKDDEQALDRAADISVGELSHVPELSTPAPRDPNQPSAWQDNPIQTTTLAQNGAAGVYNTFLNVYALHRCLDNMDHYVVTAEADWTATNAKFQSASVDDGTMFTGPEGNLLVNWQDNGQDASVTNCGVPPFGDVDQRICRYVNYPLAYALDMVPPPSGTVTQIDAAPAGSQGQAITYQSGFSFSIGGTVNVSGMGPSAGITGGATWINTTSTTVPPLNVSARDIGNEGANWEFTYCTTGQEADGGGSCTSHVQTTSGCRNRLGDNSGTNPQLGQTPGGKFSNAHWEAGPDTRVGSTFDISVSFAAIFGKHHRSSFG